MSLETKQKLLLDTIRNYGRVAVAFSAGVDSAVVCKAAALVSDSACAVTAVSPSMASGELEEAKQLAELIGIRHIIVQTDEFQNPNYTSNPSDRCRYCKTELYSQIASRHDELGFDVIANGTNADDLGDYRPGLEAAAEFKVRSPLVDANCNKTDVRELAKLWNLPVWDKPATPCLSSRIAYGTEVTPERLRRIDQAEQFLKQELNLRELRVRCEAKDHARIEVPVAAIPGVTSIQEQVFSTLLGFGFESVSIDPTGFRSGSMNEALPLVTLKLPE